VKVRASATKTDSRTAGLMISVAWAVSPRNVQGAVARSVVGAPTMPGGSERLWLQKNPTVADSCGRGVPLAMRSCWAATGAPQVQAASSRTEPARIGRGAAERDIETLPSWRE